MLLESLLCFDRLLITKKIKSTKLLNVDPKLLNASGKLGLKTIALIRLLTAFLCWPNAFRAIARL